jgi:hypothetical protein
MPPRVQEAARLTSNRTSKPLHVTELLGVMQPAAQGASAQFGDST